MGVYPPLRPRTARVTVKHPRNGWKGGGGVLDRRDVLDLIMHGSSRMTMDPRIPTMPGRSMSGFH